MTNPVLILTHNCLEQTKRCVASIKEQDVDTDIVIYDNCSTDGTDNWLAKNVGVVGSVCLNQNRGVSAAWNMGLDDFFSTWEFPHVFVLNNDIVLPRWFLSSLLSCDVPFITGAPVDNMDAIAVQQSPSLAPCPHFSAFLIRREAWEKIGPFDEAMVNYCGDLDYHIRAHRLGVPLWNSSIPFYHETSSTLNNAPPRERRHIELQADADRETFYQKWGVRAGSPEYGALFTPETFSVDLPLKEKYVKV